MTQIGFNLPRKVKKIFKFKDKIIDNNHFLGNTLAKVENSLIVEHTTTFRLKKTKANANDYEKQLKENPRLTYLDDMSFSRVWDTKLGGYIYNIENFPPPLPIIKTTNFKVDYELLDGNIKKNINILEHVEGITCLIYFKNEVLYYISHDFKEKEIKDIVSEFVTEHNKKFHKILNKNYCYRFVLTGHSLNNSILMYPEKSAYLIGVTNESGLSVNIYKKDYIKGTPFKLPKKYNTFREIQENGFYKGIIITDYNNIHFSYINSLYSNVYKLLTEIPYHSVKVFCHYIPIGKFVDLLLNTNIGENAFSKSVIELDLEVKNYWRIISTFFKNYKTEEDLNARVKMSMTDDKEILLTLYRKRHNLDDVQKYIVQKGYLIPFVKNVCKRYYEEDISGKDPFTEKENAGRLSDKSSIFDY